MKSNTKLTIILIILVSSIFSTFTPAEESANFELKKLNLTQENSLPPFNEFNYFQNKDSFPFENDTKEFSLVNAWWLSEMSTLSYSTPRIATPIFKNAGFNNVTYISVKGTQVYILSNKDSVFIVFRGTEVHTKRHQNLSQAIVDWIITDAAIFWVKTKYSEGKVHKGFKKGLDHVWDKITAHLESIDSTQKNVWITGHSLGASLATLAANRYLKTYGQAPGLYTYGSPRVGNIIFKNNFNIDHYRFVNHRDAVSEVPFNISRAFEDEYHNPNFNGVYDKEPSFMNTWIYIHLGSIKYFDIEGNLSSIKPKKQILRTRDGDKMSDLGLDHTPTLYSARTWNALISNL